MKKQIVEKIIALGFVLAAAGIALFLYKEGKISFLPDKTSGGLKTKKRRSLFLLPKRNINFLIPTK